MGFHNIICASIERRSYPLFKVPLLSHVHVFLWAISLVCQLRYPRRCFSSHFNLLDFFSGYFLLIILQVFPMILPLLASLINICVYSSYLWIFTSTQFPVLVSFFSNSRGLTWNIKVIVVGALGTVCKGFVKKTKGHVNKRSSGNNPNYRIVKIGQDTAYLEYMRLNRRK